MYDLTIYVEDDYKKVPYDKSGVYVIENNKNEVLYVGKAHELRHRIKSHFSGKSKNTFHFHHEMYKCNIIYTQRFHEDLEEQRLISELKPKYNIDLVPNGRKIKKLKALGITANDVCEEGWEMKKERFEHLKGVMSRYYQEQNFMPQSYFVPRDLKWLIETVEEQQKEIDQLKKQINSSVNV